MTLKFMWRETKTNVASQVLCTQISKHGIITKMVKYGNDIKIHVT